MAYTITLTNGAVLTTIPDNSVDNTTSLGLLGRNMSDYGTIVADNFVHILENFANTAAPTNPLIGQIWYDTNAVSLKVWTGTAWQLVGFSPPTGVTTSQSITIQDTTASNTGLLFYDPSSPSGSRYYRMRARDDGAYAGHWVLESLYDDGLTVETVILDTDAAGHVSLAVSPSLTDDSTRIATTAFVQAKIATIPAGPTGPAGPAGSGGGGGGGTSSSVSSYILLQDQEPSGTNGGAFGSGWITRTLNTKVADTNNICTLASNQFTLPAGTYRIKASAPALGVDAHQARLYNVTDGAVVAYGTSSECTGSSTADQVESVSWIDTVVTITSSKNFSIQHQAQNTWSNTAALGFALGFSGNTEVYTNVEIFQLNAPGTTVVSPGVQVFTTSGTFVVPVNVTSVEVEVWGGGGGASGSQAGVAASCGAGGGGYARKLITGLTSGSTVSVTVGAGGTGGSYVGGATGGGTTSFGLYVSASGGGAASVSSIGIGGVGSGGDINLLGGYGWATANDGASSSNYNGGAGGAGAAGGAGGGAGVTPGDPGSVPGGGGAGSGSSSTANGGNGGSGMCVVRWGGTPVVNTRIKLNANISFYVSTSGSDSNDGLSSGTAWLTLQHAMNIIAQNYDLAGYTATVNLAAGTYTGNTTIPSYCTGNGGGTIVINGAGQASTTLSSSVAYSIVLNVGKGNVVTIQNLAIQATNCNCFSIAGIATITNLNLTASGTSSIAYKVAGVAIGMGVDGTCFVGTGVVISLSSATAAVEAGIGSIFTPLTSGVSITISGSSQYGFLVGGCGQIQLSYMTITANLTVSTQFLSAYGCAYLGCVGTTWSGTVTGQKYFATSNGVVDSEGSLASIPGTVAGTTGYGGQAI